jgi:hypothetical protein
MWKFGNLKRCRWVLFILSSAQKPPLPFARTTRPGQLRYKQVLVDSVFKRHLYSLQNLKNGQALLAPLCISTVLAQLSLLFVKIKIKSFKYISKTFSNIVAAV